MAQVKKTNKKTTAKRPVAKAAAVAPAVECQCQKHGVCWKKVLIFILGVIVGAVACCAVCRKGGHKIWGKKFLPTEYRFVNGCVDVSKIECPEKAEKVQLKDANKDGCVTKEEFFGEPKGDPRPMPRKMRKQRMPRAE